MSAKTHIITQCWVCCADLLFLAGDDADKCKACGRPNEHPVSEAMQAWTSTIRAGSSTACVSFAGSCSRSYWRIDAGFP